MNKFGLIKKGVAVILGVSMLLCSSCTPKKDSTSSDIKVNEEQCLSTQQKGGGTVDFSIREGTPLFKKYAYFLIGGTPLDTINKYASRLKDLRSRAVRFSLVVTAEDDEPNIYRLNMQNAMKAYGNNLNKYTIPYWHMSYVKSALSDENKKKDPENYMFYEPDYNISNNAWKTVSSYFNEKNIRCYYEVWNEPDQPFWTKFDWDGYIRLYKNTANAVREGNPFAMIGGLSSSHLSVMGMDNYQKFLSEISKDKTPIDYVTFHDYDKGYIEEIPQISAELGKNDYFKKTQIHYTEFNIHNIAMEEWEVPLSERKDNFLQKSKCVPDMLTAIEKMNDFTDVTMIQWAVFTMESEAFAIMLNDGTRTPAFHAQYLYAHMPVERVKASSNNDDVSIMASGDETCSAVMLWNTSEGNQKVNIDLKNIPLKNYKATVYRIDNEHSNFMETGSDELSVVETLDGLSGDTLNWSGNIPPKGTVYIELTTEKEKNIDKEISVGDIIRNENFFEKRNTTNYVDFDEQTSTAILGMSDNERARSVSAITYSKINDKVKVNTKITGQLSKLTDNSALSVRVDYYTGDNCTYACEYVADITSDNRSSQVGFGTMKKADKIEKVNFNSFEMDIKGNAPKNWNGKVVITFDMQDSGKYTEAMISLS